MNFQMIKFKILMGIYYNFYFLKINVIYWAGLGEKNSKFMAW